MQASEKIIEEICARIPGANPELVKAVLEATGKAQIFFAAGKGQVVVDGKSEYPDYLQVQVSSSYDAARLAQQLMSACAEALSNHGQLRAPVLLLLAGHAEISE